MLGEKTVIVELGESQPMLGVNQLFWFLSNSPTWTHDVIHECPI